MGDSADDLTGTALVALGDDAGWLAYGFIDAAFLREQWAALRAGDDATRAGGGSRLLKEFMMRALRVLICGTDGVATDLLTGLRQHSVQARSGRASLVVWAEIDAAGEEMADGRPEGDDGWP